MSEINFPIETLPEFFTKLLLFTDGVENIWYRGHKNSNYKLIPTAYRWRSFCSNSNEYEKTILAKAKSGMFHFTETRDLIEKNNWLTYIQHIGMKTRLLDWSYDLSTALYFAFEEFIVKENTGSIENIELPCIWVLKVDSFMELIRELFSKPTENETDIYNMISFFNSKFQHSGLDSGISGRVSDFFKKPYIKSAEEVTAADKLTPNQNPLDSLLVPFQAPFVHERPKTQGGCFIRFPYLDRNTDIEESSLKSLEKFCETFDFPVLGKFVFRTPQEVFNQLNIFNLNVSKVYPEAMNIAYDINNTAD